MNGPEHYTEAEALLVRAANAEGMGHAEELIGRAQVHATLAAAAAAVVASGRYPRGWDQIVVQP